MNTIQQAASRFICAAALGTLLLPSAYAEMSAEELAKLAQNPVGNLISLPFQNNTNLNFGPEKGTQNVLNIQPVIPISVNDDWNIITRTIVPVISFPRSTRAMTAPTASATPCLLPSCHRPSRGDGLIWGAGPVVQLPTNSNSELGNKTGTGAVGRRVAPRKGRPLGLRDAGQQHLVALQQTAGRFVQ